MKDFNDILNTDFLNSAISDELLAAYIDGKTTESENALIESTLNGDPMLSEAYEIASDSVSFGSNFDWELHKGDFGFWELGLPPLVTEEDIIETNNKTEADMAKKTYGYEPNNELDTFDPNIWQGNQPTCAIRSQEIILRDYGIAIPQGELIQFAIQNGWYDPDPVNGGTPRQYVGNILNACGIPTQRTENATIYDIISELRAGHRVIVSVDADELWIKKEPSLVNRLFGDFKNKVQDAFDTLNGVQGANHALIVAGVTVNPKDPSDIRVTLIDSGRGDACIEYKFSDFEEALADSNHYMIFTTIPAPYQYNYETHEMEPSSFYTDYTPSIPSLPMGIHNKFVLDESYYVKYADYTPEYRVISSAKDHSECENSKTENDDSVHQKNEDDTFNKKEDDIQSSLNNGSYGYDYNVDLIKEHNNTLESVDNTNEDNNEHTETYEEIDGDSLSVDE